MQKKSYKSIRVFRSPILEWFTHVHPLTPLFIWMPVVGFLLWRSFTVLQIKPLAIAMFGLAGFMVWTVCEYFLHRFVFHLQGDSKWSQKIHFLVHGLHHDDPNDPTRLVMPPLPAFILAVITFTLFRLLLGPVWVTPFFAMFIFGYLCYDYIHYSIHHFNPKTRVGRFLKQSHMQHHFIDHNTRWGVSSPVWDYVFGTMESEDLKNKGMTSNPHVSG